MGYFVSRRFVESSLDYTGQEMLLWLIMLGSFVYASAYAAYGPLNCRIRLMKPAELYQRVHTCLVLLIGLVVLGTLFEEVTFMFAVGVAAPMVAVLSRWPGLKPALVGSIFYTLIAHGTFYVLLLRYGRNDDPDFILMSVALLGITMGLALAGRFLQPMLGREKLRILHWLHAGLGLLMGVFILWCFFSGNALMLSLAIASVIIALSSRWPGVEPGFLGSLLYTAIAHVLFYSLVYDQGRSGDMVFLWVSILLALITVAYGLVGRRVLVTLDVGKVQRLQWFGGALSLGLLYSLFFCQGGALHHYVTALWGLSAISILGMGLVFGAKPLRVLGLIGLAICIPRVFIVDVRSTLYRIIAFGALSIVLLLVGFIYNKFRDTIQKQDEQIPAGKKEEEVVK